jgi:acyl carrier protein
MTEHINRKILEYIYETHPRVQSLTFCEDTQLSGILDSLAVLGLIGFLESEFSIQMSPSEMTDENFESVRTISRLVVRLGELAIR